MPEVRPDWVQDLETTTTATPVVTISYPLPAMTVAGGRARIYALSADGDAAQFDIDVNVFRGPTGGAQVIGMGIVIKGNLKNKLNNWNATVGVSGNDVQVSVTGEAGKTIYWLSRLNLTMFSPLA